MPYYKKIFLYSLLTLLICSCHSFYKDKNTSNKTKIINTKIILIQSHLNKGKLQSALKLAKNIYKKHPNDHSTLRTMGIVSLALGNEKNALYFFKKSYKSKKSSSTLLNLSSLYINKGKLYLARKMLVKIIKDTKYSSPERAYHNLGYSYEVEKKYQKAIKYYKKSLIINPYYYLSAISLAEVYKNLAKYKSAYIYAKKATKYCPLCYKPIEILAWYYTKNKDKKKLAKIINQYLSQEDISSQNIKRGNNLLSLANRKL
jgi:Tfp pilus assembly protein PilF